MPQSQMWIASCQMIFLSCFNAGRTQEGGVAQEDCLDSRTCGNQSFLSGSDLKSLKLNGWANSVDTLIEKADSCAQELSRWNREEFGNVGVEIKKLEEVLKG